MATSTGFADGAADLLSKLRTFLTANSWVEQRWTAGDEFIVKGVGSGSDAIYVGIKIFSDATNDNYGWILQGFTGYSSGNTFATQPGNMGTVSPCLPLLQSNPVNANAIKYWFICNNRCFKVVARVGSTYQHCYMGWILPYGNPGEWPYPMAIGGSTYYETAYGSTAGPYRYSNTSGKLSAYFAGDQQTLAIKDAGGSWQKFVYSTASVSTASGLGRTSLGVWPKLYIADNFGYGKSLTNLRPDLNGNYSLTPLIISWYDTSNHNLYGEFDGVKYVTGYSQSSENTISYNSQTWLVFNDTYKSSLSDFVAYQNV